MTQHSLCSGAGELQLAGSTGPRSSFQGSCIAHVEGGGNSTLSFQKLLITIYFFVGRLMRSQSHFVYTQQSVISCPL